MQAISCSSPADAAELSFDRLLAHAAPGALQDAQQCGVVFVPVDQPQPGDDVLDLLAVEKRAGADEDVRHAGLAKKLLEQPRLLVGPEKHSAMARLNAARCDPRGDRGDRLTGLGRFIRKLHDGGRRSTRAGCHQLLVVADPVEADQRVGQLQNRIATAVVFFEPDGHRVWPVLPEGEDMADFGSAPAIDRLVVVANDAKISMALSEGPHDPVLAAVGVLVFVDKNLVKAAGFDSQYIGMLAEQAAHQEQQIIEVNRSQPFELLLVAAVGNRSKRRPVRIGFAGRGVRRQAAGLPCADLPDQLTGRKRGVGDVDFTQDAPRDGFLVPAGVNREPGRVAQPADVAAENPNAERMKSRNQRAFAELAWQHRPQPLLHLASGLVGKRDGKNPGRGSSRADQLGDPERDHPRLSRPRAGQYEKRAGPVGNGSLLWGIQSGHDSGSGLDVGNWGMREPPAVSVSVTGRRCFSKM
jgi:hypothetical protein